MLENGLELLEKLCYFYGLGFLEGLEYGFVLVQESEYFVVELQLGQLSVKDRLLPLMFLLCLFLLFLYYFFSKMFHSSLYHFLFLLRVLFLPFPSFLMIILWLIFLFFRLNGWRRKRVPCSSGQNGQHLSNSIESIFDKIQRNVSNSVSLPQLLTYNRYLNINTNWMF